MNQFLIQSSVGKICVNIIGNEHLPELYFLHGGMGLGSDSLQPYFENLSNVFRCIFIDLPGCGNSENSIDSIYSFETFNTVIISVLENVSKNNTRGIFGHSLGGMIALNHLGSNLNQFKFGILSNTAMNSKWREISKDNLSKIMNEKIKFAIADYQSDSDSSAKLQNLATSYAPLYFPELPLVESEKIMSSFTYHVDTISYLGDYIYPNLELSNQVKNISVPILQLCGNQDLVVPVFCQNEIDLLLASPKSILKFDAGHFPFITKTNEFISGITTWWNYTKEVLK
jgi:pimeloyl-ACP methyl ester carboxylesterase